MAAVLSAFGIFLARMIAGGALLVAGVAKISSAQDRFLSAVLGFDLVPERIARILARWLPWLESLTGGMLLIGFMSQEAVLVAFGLFFIFSTAIVVSLARGRDNDCGCFGRLTPVQWRLVYRNVFLMGLLIPVFSEYGGPLAVDRWVGVGDEPAISLFSSQTLPLLSLWGIALAVVILIQGLIRFEIVRIDDNHRG